MQMWIMQLMFALLPIHVTLTKVIVTMMDSVLVLSSVEPIITALKVQDMVPAQTVAMTIVHNFLTWKMEPLEP